MVLTGNPITTKGLKLDWVGPFDNRPSTYKDGGMKQLLGWTITITITKAEA